MPERETTNGKKRVAVTKDCLMVRYPARLLEVGGAQHAVS